MKILHLYYDLMNLYGEYGNVAILKKHLEDQKINVIVDQKTIGDNFEFNDYDFIYCGSGLESNLKVALDDLLTRKVSLIKAIENDKYLLFTGNSMELLGETIDDKEALNIVPISSNHTNRRYTGDVIVHNDEFGELVGFINKSTIVVQLSKDGIFKYVFKDENLKDGSNQEGYRYKNLIGTHIIGPILVKNPQLLKYYVMALGKNNSKRFTYKQISYPYEEDAYEVTLNALKNRSANTK